MTQRSSAKVDRHRGRVYAGMDWSCVGRQLNGSTQARFFLAADAAPVIEEARLHFPDRVVTTAGIATHIERDAQYYSLNESAKTLLDWFLLAYSGRPISANVDFSSFSAMAVAWGRTLGHTAGYRKALGRSRSRDLAVCGFSREHKVFVATQVEPFFATAHRKTSS